MSKSQDNVRGLRSPSSRNGKVNEAIFLTEIMLNRLNTALPVRVDAVEKAEGPDGPAGYVSVTPLIKQTDAWNNALIQTTVHKLPYFRHQAGKAAIILDPRPGDVGLAVFAQDDASKLPRGEENPTPGSPGRFRKFSKSDGFYFGGILGQTPETWIELDPEGGNITVHGPETVTVECREAVVKADESVEIATRKATLTVPLGFTVNGNVHINGSIGWTGEATGDGMGGPARFRNGLANAGGTLRSNNTTLETHVHTGVEPGHGDTGGPR